MRAMQREGYIKPGTIDIANVKPGENAKLFRSGPEHFVTDMVAKRVRELLGDDAALGLDRPLADLLRTGPVRQAYDRLVAGGARDGSDVLVTTRAGARLLEARMRLLRLEGQETERPGYVLALRDVSGDLPVLAERAHLFDRLIDGVRGAQTLEDARALAELQHPYIVGVHQIFHDNGTAYMAMDYVAGRNLLRRGLMG